MRAFLLQTPGEFHLAPHLDAGGLAGRKYRVVCGNTGGDNDEVEVGLDDRACESLRIIVDVNINAGDVIEEQGLSPTRVEGTHLPVAREQCASGPLSGLAPADDSSETAHRRDTHSA